jgi:hypothetical protein
MFDVFVVVSSTEYVKRYFQKVNEFVSNVAHVCVDAARVIPVADKSAQ